MSQYQEINWFTATETRARGRQMSAPYGNIHIGCDPLNGMTLEDAKSYDAIINVSCTQCAYFYPAYPGQAMHWYPLNEMGYWGYGSLFFVKQVLDFHYDKGHKIYLHCHAGAYRSPTMAIFWLVSKGHTLDEALEIEKNSPKFANECKTERDRFFRYGNMPEKYQDFYDRYRNYEARKKPDSQASIADILLSGKHWIENTREVFGDKRVRWTIARKRIFPTFYAVRDWFREKRTDTKRFLLGQKFTPWSKGSRCGEILNDPESRIFKLIEKLPAGAGKKYRNFFS